MQMSLQTVSFISSSLFMQMDNPSRPWSSMNSSRFPSCGSFIPDLSFFQNVIYFWNYRILYWRINSLDWAIPFLLWLWNYLLVFGPASYNLDKVARVTLYSSWIRFLSLRANSSSCLLSLTVASYYSFLISETNNVCVLISSIAILNLD